MSHPARRKTFIDPTVQGALVRRLVLHWSAFIAVASLVAFSLQVLSNPFQPLEEHVQQAWRTHGPFFLVLFFILPAFIVDTIKLSHRFAGPIYRLRNTIRSLAKGEKIAQVKFRESDFWQGMADDFNAMIERFAANNTGSSAPLANENEEWDPLESTCRHASLSIL